MTHGMLDVCAMFFFGGVALVSPARIRCYVRGALLEVEQGLTEPNPPLYWSLSTEFDMGRYASRTSIQGVRGRCDYR